MPSKLRARLLYFYYKHRNVLTDKPRQGSVRFHLSRHQKALKRRKIIVNPAAKKVADSRGTRVITESYYLLKKWISF